jgi:hypothetical protein
MSRFAMTLALFACAMFAFLPVFPVQADMILPEEPAAAAETPADEDAPSTRVGAFLSGEEWWQVPLGLAFILGAAYTGYIFIEKND